MAGQQPFVGSAPSFARAPTWDMLEMPEIDFLQIPVEEFFPEYLTELNRGGQQPTGLAHALTGPQHASGTQEINGLQEAVPMNGVESGAPHGSTLNGYSSYLPPVPLPVVTSGTPMGTASSTSGGSGNWNQQAVQLDARQNSNPGWPTQGFGGRESGGAKASEDGDEHEHDPDQDFDPEDEDQDGDNQSPRAGRARSKPGQRELTRPKRNPKQQVLNKQAQQRYRQRRKAKFNEMEEALDALSVQVREMQDVQTQNSTLKGKTVALETMLQAKDTEIEALRSALDRSRQMGPQGGAQGQAPQGEPGEPEAELSPADVQAAREHDILQFQREFANTNVAMRAWVEKHRLRDVDPLGRGVDERVVAETARMVGQGCATCQRVMRASGIKVLELMSKDLVQMTRIECKLQRAKWLRILEVLRLSSPQEDALMSLRAEHLAALRAIYTARQRLNMQAMGLMLPAEAARGTSSNPDLESKINCMTLNGYTYCARKNVDLDDTLDQIKGNLREEQKTVMQLNFKATHRVLSPIQAALFVVEAYPGHTDCLALANIVAFVRKADPPTDANPLDCEASAPAGQAAGGEKPPAVLEEADMVPQLHEGLAKGVGPFGIARGTKRMALRAGSTELVPTSSDENKSDTCSHNTNNHIGQKV